MYCSNCGSELQTGVRYCPYCGTAVTALATNVPASALTSGKEYQIVLVSRGSCSTSLLQDLLEDVFGYSSVQASSLINNIPVQIAQNLSDEEAAVIAQMFAEYGAEVTVLDEKQTYVDLSHKASSSIFNSDGSLLSKAAAIIGALTIANRVTSYQTIRKPSLLERIFRPLFQPKPKKVYIRTNHHKPQPAPQTHHMSKPKPQPIYRNTMERQQKPVSGHHGGPNGRMKGPGRTTKW